MVPSKSASPASKPVVLASASPRRAELLALLGLEFAVDVADVDERPCWGEPPDELVLRLSRKKADAVAERYPGAVVLAADTVVVHNATILGKPVDTEDAEQMLRALRNKVHEVYTAVSLAQAGRLASRLSRSDVWMRDYGDHEIHAYVASGDPLDKAGAYAIQNTDFAPVDHYEGCYTAIMGLPIGITAEMLAEAGVALPTSAVDACEQVARYCCLRPPH